MNYTLKTQLGDIHFGTLEIVALVGGAFKALGKAVEAEQFGNLEEAEKYCTEAEDFYAAVAKAATKAQQDLRAWKESVQ